MFASPLTILLREVSKSTLDVVEFALFMLI